MVRLVNGELLVLAAGDDISFSNRAERSWDILSENKDCACVSFSTVKFKGTINTYKEWRNKESRRSLVRKSYRKHSIDDLVKDCDFHLNGAARSFRKSVFDYFGPLEANTPTEDSTILLRCLLKGHVVHSEEKLVLYRVHGGNYYASDRKYKINYDQIHQQYLKDISRVKSVGEQQGSVLDSVEKALRQRLIKRQLRSAYFFSRNSLIFFLRSILFSSAFRLKEKIRFFKKEVSSGKKIFIKIVMHLKFLLLMGMAKFDQKSVLTSYYNIQNFGDQLTPDIIRFFGLRPIHCPRFKFSSMVGVGSILEKLPKDYEGYILGSGFIENTPIQFPKAKVLLVRGNLTRINLGLSESTLLGDPGLIADKMYKDNLCDVKEWDVGIIPHYRDMHQELIKDLLSQGEGISVKLIDVRNSPAEVVEEISKCSCILSSSLHGLIVADSLGIPNRWIKISEGLMGKGFKFDDYYSCFDTKKAPVQICWDQKLSDLIKKVELLPKDRVDEVKENIHLAYSKFSKSCVKSTEGISARTKTET